MVLFKEIIAVYHQNHMKPINSLTRQNAELMIVKEGSTYSYQWVLVLNTLRILLRTQKLS
jgi:uncharacterized membrane protein